MDEAHLLVGEKLLDEQKVTSLYESERNLWVAEVDGFETEMQISPSRVKACSCECGVFLKEKMCGHVAAGLLALRKRISEKKARKSNVAGPGKTYQKLTVNAILDQVGKEELSAFVRHYASTNRNFSIALKTRFAGAVPMVDNTEKYRQVMDSVIKSALNKNGRISSPGTKQILATGEDFLGQATDSMALEHYVESWSVLKVLIEKVVPAINRADFEKAALLEFSQAVFTLLEQLVGQPIPPTLRLEIWQFLLVMAVRPIYRGYDQLVPIFKQLLLMADDKSKFESLLSLIDQELKRSATLSDIHHQQLVACKWAVLQKRGFGKTYKTYEQEVLASPEQVLFHVATAVKHGLVDVAKSLGVKGLAVSSHRLFQYRLKMDLLNIALQENDRDRVAAYAKDCFVYSGNVKYLRQCKQHHSGDWEAVFEEIENDIRQLDSRDKNQHLADLYGEDKRISELKKLVLEIGTVDFTMQVDRYFLPDFQKDLKEVYTQVLDQYFSTHLGIKPTQKMMDLFAHLRKLGAPSLVDQLASFVRKNYPNRLDLALELMTL